jgi:hypothetical protein
MNVTDATADRAAAADRWQAAREGAAAYAAGNSELRRDQRVEEAKASDAARPRPQDRAAAGDARARPSSAAKFVDVFA